MSTVNDPLTQGINALTAYANEVTGASDTNLSDAVYTLAQGYNGGNSSASVTYPDVDGKPLTASINALLTYANEITGAGDTTLSDAVYTLAQGYNSSDLPSTYQEVEYIESSGTQYIDTGILCNAGIKVVCRMGWVNSGNNNEQLWGARSTGGATRFFITSYGGIDFAHGKDIIRTITSVARQVYDLLYDTTTFASSTDIVFKFGYDENYYSQTIAFVNTNLSMYIFGSNRSSYSSSSFLSKAIFESMTITDSDGNILFNGIPCYRKSDGEIGIYDTATGTFFTNQGTSTFLKGADV